MRSIQLKIFLCYNSLNNILFVDLCWDTLTLLLFCLILMLRLIFSIWILYFWIKLNINILVNYIKKIFNSWSSWKYLCVFSMYSCLFICKWIWLWNWTCIYHLFLTKYWSKFHFKQNLRRSFLDHEQFVMRRVWYTLLRK